MKYYLIYLNIVCVCLCVRVRVCYIKTQKKLTRKRLRLKQHTLTAIKNKNDPSKLLIKNSANL